MLYNWQQPDWPHFSYNLEQVEDILEAFTIETAHISGIIKALPEQVQWDTIINIMVTEAIKTSEIEGELLNRTDVMSSIRNNLGVNENYQKVHDRKSQGAGELMVAVRKSFDQPLSEDMLFEWHRILMTGNSKINTGCWRSHNEPMQVVSGTIGREKIHFEAPPSSQVHAEMKKFIRWFNETSKGEKKEIKKAPVRAAIAHLYFESIHPFEDGNGRIGRAIAEKALSQTLQRPVVLSLSKIIEKGKKEYYKSLETAQKNNEISGWIRYFVNVIHDAQTDAANIIELTLSKVKFFNRYKELLNARQLKVINKMFESEPEGFTGGMTAKKYMSLTKASKATATRDLAELVKNNVLKAEGRGRSVFYLLNI